MSLSFLVEHAGLDPSVARKMRREDITLTVLQEATLAERREILRSMGIKYGPILAINRALEKRQRMIKEGELDDAADDEDAVADDDDVPPEATGAAPPGQPAAPAAAAEVPAGLQAAAMLLRGASAPTLRGLQLILGNALDNPDQVAFRTIQLANPLFQERVWSAPGGASLLRAAGFAEGAKRTLRLAADAPPAALEGAKALVDGLIAERGDDGRGALSPTGPAQLGVSGAGAASPAAPGSAAAAADPARREAEIRQAIDLARLQINSRMGHLHSWDNALAMGTLVDVETLSADEVRSCRACNQGRLAALLGRIVARLDAVSAPHPPEREAAARVAFLNVTNVLTHLMPVLLEDAADGGVRHLLCARAPPPATAAAAAAASPGGALPADASLAERLIGGVLKAHFAPGLCVLPDAEGGDDFSWATSSASSDEARAAAMSALVACCSAALYATPRELSEAPHPLVLATVNSPLPHLKALFRALLSVIFSYDPVGWGIPYAGAVLPDSHFSTLHVGAQLLLVLLSLPAGDGTPAAPPDDRCAKLLINLRREETLAFVAAGFGKLLPNAHVVASTYLPSSQLSLECHEELLVLLWKCLSLNHAFLATLLASDALPDVLAALAYGILSWAEDVSKASMVHLSILCLLLLSAEKDFSSVVNAPCPRAFTLAEPYADACAGTLADLLVAAAAAIVVGGGVRLESVLPAALAVLANITPHVKAYSAASANRLMLMLSACWDARFLLGAPSRPDHLIALLDVISSAILHQHAANTPLLHSLVLNADALRALPAMALPAKLPPPAAGGASDFFTPTAAWLRAWKAQLPCRPIFAALDALLPKLAAASVAPHDADAMHAALRSISLAGVLPPPPPIAVRRYQSNEFSHAWLSQVLWGIIYSRNQLLFDARRVRLVQILQVQ